MRSFYFNETTTLKFHRFRSDFAIMIFVYPQRKVPPFSAVCEREVISNLDTRLTEREEENTYYEIDKHNFHGALHKKRNSEWWLIQYKTMVKLNKIRNHKFWPSLQTKSTRYIFFQKTIFLVKENHWCLK